MVKKILKLIAAALLIGGIFIVSIIWHVRTEYLKEISSIEDAAHAPVVMVLGATLKDDGSLSSALEDRLKVGLDVYREGKAEKILVTGDDGKMRTPETAAMQKYLLDAGVTTTDVLVDGEGYRTYESCKRAAEVFNFHQAIIVTQGFHMPRALYLCENFGIKSEGVTSDLREYPNILTWTVRDLLASFKAWMDLNIMAPKPPV